MKRILIFLSFFVFVGCSSTLKREGYSPKNLVISGKECAVVIKKSYSYKKEEVEVLGIIKAGDSGFSVKCGEAYVLAQFKQEACALGADLINILDEKRFDILSSCYRAKAEFLRIKNREQIKDLVSDPVYVR